MIVGTAGHVDHGKTALIQRLTGIDTDRLKEEKARGLTIEPGFAYPEVAEGVELGFVDVPGHVRFLHHMMAGSAGVDTVLLVVAADDGVMPQTVEHLQIVSLLGLSRGLVALTKVDRVDAARRRQVREEIATLLAGTPLAEAPLHEVSSTSGEGVDALRERLWAMASAQHETLVHGHFRFVVDRVFTKRGAGVVALTKVDRVDAARRRQAQEEVTALLAGTPLEGAPIHEVSSHTGEGVETLRDRLWTLAARQQELPVRGHFRLAVDRVFTKRGAGVVVTGTALAGRVSLGDTLRLLPSGLTARVRGLRRQHRDSDQARQGDRVALNLAGAGIERDAIRRGDWVLGAALEAPLVKRFDVELGLLDSAPTLKHWSPVQVHLGVGRYNARVSLLEGKQLAAGETMLGQLVLEEPVHGCLGDRCVIRDPTGGITLGGATLLANDPPRRGQRRPERLAWLSALSHCAATTPLDLTPALQEGLGERPGHQPAGIDLLALARNANVELAMLVDSVAALGGETLASSGQHRALSAEAIAALETRLLDSVAANHEREPSMMGTERGRLARQAIPWLPEATGRQLIERLVACGKLEPHGPFVALPGHQASLGEADEALWQRLEPRIAEAGFQPPRVRDLAADESLDEDDLDETRIREVLIACARLGRLYQLRRDHFYPAATVAEMAALLQALEREHGRIRAAAFRDRIGTGRKLAIHILEFFDKVGFTRRIGDERVIRHAEMWR